MNMDLSSPTALAEEDFRRLGLPDHECRLEVIRHAALQRSVGLAQRQLRSPSRRDRDRLSQLAMSTYRVLDPRQRENISHRVHIGRILVPEQLDTDITRFARCPASASGVEHVSLSGVRRVERRAAVPAPARVAVGRHGATCRAIRPRRIRCVSTTAGRMVRTSRAGALALRAWLAQSPRRGRLAVTLPPADGCVRARLHGADLLQPRPQFGGRLVRRVRQFQARWSVVLMIAATLATTTALATWSCAAAESRGGAAEATRDGDAAPALSPERSVP